MWPMIDAVNRMKVTSCRSQLTSLKPWPKLSGNQSTTPESTRARAASADIKKKIFRSEQDEGDIVQEPAHLSQALAEAQREPEHHAGEHQSQSRERRHKKEDLLPAAVLADLRVLR